MTLRYHFDIEGNLVGRDDAQHGPGEFIVPTGSQSRRNRRRSAARLREHAPSTGTTTATQPETSESAL